MSEAEYNALQRIKDERSYWKIEAKVARKQLATAEAVNEAAREVVRCARVILPRYWNFDPGAPRTGATNLFDALAAYDRALSTTPEGPQ